MNHAIETLRRQAETCETSAPIHEAEEKTEQAALDRDIAKECREAIAALTVG